MTEDNFNLQKFSHGIYLDCSQSTAYDHIAKAEGFTKWFIGQADYVSGNIVRLPGNYIQAGDSFIWKWLAKDLELKGTILKAEKDAELTFTFGLLHEVKIILYESNTRTHLRLEQYYIPGAEPNDFLHINCAVCWVFFLTNLKSVIEHGNDLRETAVDDEELVNR